MSDTILYLVPADPLYQPPRDAAMRAAEYVKQILPHTPVPSPIGLIFEDSVRLFHVVGNSSTIHCPYCGEDVEDWWWTAVDEAYEKTIFSSLLATTPCCSRQVVLHDLTFDAPIRFGRFALEITNPNVYPLPTDWISNIEGVLGTPVREVWARI